MKTYFIALVFFLLAVYCKADCAGGGFGFWPQGDTLLPNSFLTIEGYAGDQEIIRQLNKKYKVFLRSGNKRVNLRVQETNEGQLYITQALLVPETSLQAGLEYTLCIEGEEKVSVNRYDIKKHAYVPVKWTVAAHKKVQHALWVKKPVEKEKSVEEFGCGPAKYVKFSCAVSHAEYALVRAHVTHVKTKRTADYLVPIDSDNTITIGHNMCVGAFTFIPGEYEVYFELVDFSDNDEAAYVTSSIKFTAPTGKNSR